MNDPSTSNLADEDEVIREIPIFNSTRLQKNLYLFMYSLLTKNCSNDLQLRHGFFKPNNQEVELEMCIDVESTNFDSDRAELIAEEVDGELRNNSSSKKPLFENNSVDKVILKSSEVVQNPTNYAAMVYTGREIHFTTLKNIFQFHPSFTYLDRKSKKSKDVDHNELSDDEEVVPKAAQPVTVKFKQINDNEKSKNSNPVKQINPNELFVACDIHNKGSTLGNMERLKLMAENTEPTGQATNLNDAEYLRILIPEDEGEGTNEPSSPSHVMSLHTLRASPILEQCRVLLKDANIIQFQQLLMILAGGEGLTSEVLLKNLAKVAVLVRGNWVVKSEILYPSDTFSSTSGVPSELMCRTRDYVLYLFTKNQYVERKKVSSVMKIPSEEVKEIFMGFSKLSHNKGWELALPADSDFIMKHSDIVQKQKLAWEEKFKQLSAFLKDNQKQRRKSKSVSESNL